MLQRYHFWRLATLLIWSAASLAAGQDPFKFTPPSPVPGQALEIGFKPDATVKMPFSWVVTATDIEKGTNVAKPDAGLPEGEIIEEAVLKISKVRAKTRYVIAVSFSRNDEEEAWRILLDFDDTKSTARTITPPEMAPAPPVPGATAPTPSAEVAPKFLEDDKASVQDRLRAAHDWAERIAKFAKTDNLIVSIEFIKEAIGKRREHTSDSTKRLVHSDLKRQMDRPLLDAALLQRAVDAVLTSQPEDAAAATLELAWAAEKERFVSALVEEAAEAKSTSRLWRAFLDEWQAEAKRVAPERFRDALRELPLVITAILLDYERQHILNAMTGGGPRGTATTAGGVGGQYPIGFGASHAAVHHARAMSRIHWRHQRHMARFGAY
jgi:hypothetical protein